MLSSSISKIEGAGWNPARTSINKINYETIKNFI